MTKLELRKERLEKRDFTKNEDELVEQEKFISHLSDFVGMKILNEETPEETVTLLAKLLANEKGKLRYEEGY